MPPKKDKDKKKKGGEEPEAEVQSLYVKREPLPVPEPPDVAEAQDAWKASRTQFLQPLPEWDAEAVDLTEWLSPNGEPFVAGNFSAQALPKGLLGIISSSGAWKRAPASADGDAPKEEEPRAQSMPESEEPPATADGKEAKGGEKAKAKAKPDAKKKGESEPKHSGRDTMGQFAAVEGQMPETDMCVVTDEDMRTREAELSHDEALPPFSQAMASQLALVAEHRSLMPRGSFLWELIYPQDNNGKPIFNPHGKYIVKLFVQGQWRQILIDDVVPVGSAGGSNCAPMFPTSASPNAIWPQLLTKALARAFQAELSNKTELPNAVTALTGWLPFQQAPLTWEALRSAFAYRPFCCINGISKPDPESRKRDELFAQSAEAQKGAQKPEVPALDLPSKPMAARLVGSLREAPMHFLVCQVGEEPQQVRLKVGRWKPDGGTSRKWVLRDGQVEHEEDDLEDEDEDGDDEDGEDSLHEGADEEEDEAVGDEAQGSARSQGEGSQEPAAVEPGAEQDVAPQEEEPLWPEGLPAPAMPRSEVEAFRNGLTDGYWLTFDEVRKHCDSLVTYMPPSEQVLRACLDCRWGSKRHEPFSPPKLSLLRLRLEPAPAPAAPAPQAQDEPLTRPESGQSVISSQSGARDSEAAPDAATPEEPAPGAGGPAAWSRVVLHYEPLRLEPGFDKTVPLGLGGGAAACLLQRMNRWEPPSTGGPSAPQFIHLVTGDKLLGSTTRCCSLPPGEHLYVVLDEATRAGSTLTVHVDGSHLNLQESRVEFLQLSDFFQGYQVPMMSLTPAEYPVQLGFSIWAKSEVVLSGEGLASKCLEIMSHLPDSSLYQHLTLTILRLGPGGAAVPVLRTPLLSLVSLPLGPVCSDIAGAGDSIKCVLILEANVLAPAAAGTFSVQLALPPTDMYKKPEETPAGEGEAEAETAAEEDAATAPASLKAPEPKAERAPSKKEGSKSKGVKDTIPEPVAEEESQEDLGPLVLKSLPTSTVLRWNGETAPNDHQLVLAERITLPKKEDGEEAVRGPVTAALRVTVAGLPSIALKAKLVEQALPLQEMRPKVKGDVEGEWKDPEPFQVGAKVDPKEYGGRSNWLKSCRTVLEASGVEVVLLPHAVFQEGSTHLLYVYMDQYRGPGQLEGGQWTLEFFGSGDIEVGADTMEKDLEALVRKSWEEVPPQEGRPPRKDRAKASRRAWLSARGIAPPEPQPDAEGNTPPPPEEPTPDPEAEAAKAAAAEELSAARSREAARDHSNTNVAQFVLDVTEVEAVLTVEDPYTIAPEMSPAEAAAAAAAEAAAVAAAEAEAAAPEAEDEAAAGMRYAMGLPPQEEEEQAEEAEPQEAALAAPEPPPPAEKDESEVAILALSSQGRAAARKEELAAADAFWAKAGEEMAVAKQANAQTVAALAAWREENAPAPRAGFAESREAMRGGLQERLNKQAALKDLVSNADLEDPEKLRTALGEGEQVQVGVWNPELVTSATEKAELLEAFAPFKSTIAEESAKAPEEQLADPAAREQFADLLAKVKDLLAKLLAKNVPILAEACDPELMARAEALLVEPEVAATPEEPAA